MLVVFRDLLIVGGVVLLWMTTQPMLIRPLEVSKANTALQIGLVAVVLGLDAAGLQVLPVRLGMVFLVTASTLFSGAAYVVKTARGR
jgi:cardiolipin synthase